MGKAAIKRLEAGQDLPLELRGAVVAIGNFDGVHQGHQSVLQRALDIAQEAKRPAIVLTFEPHPRTVFAPQKPVFRLTPAPMKADIFAHLGFDGVVEHPFSMAFASQSPETFVADFLCGQLGVAHVVTGFDFHFGKNREGGPAYLMEAGQRLGFGVTLIDAFRDDDALVISSSRIRQSLVHGDLEQAAEMLGYRYQVTAPIIKGKQLGRTLGYPTANMRLVDGTPLKHGIYAVKFTRADGAVHDGVASFGKRPTVDEDGAPLLETFIFDFSGDLYNELCKVSLFALLRGEEKFDGLDALVEQMDKDSANAKVILAAAKPHSALDQKLVFGDAS